MLTARMLDSARRHDGLLSRTQLIDEHGVSRSWISRARRQDLLVDLMPDVYRIASSPVTFEMKCRAVQLRSRGVGYLSGWTAARLAGLRGMPERRVHVTVDDSFRISMPMWVELHRSRWYDESDRIVRPDGLLVAQPLRMLFGLAASFNQHRFERAAEDAWHLGLVTPAEAAGYLEQHRCRGKDGVAAMERWLDKALQHERPAQSHLERRLLQALELTGLPSPQRQYPLVLADGSTIHLDIAWPDIRLAVEPGASWWHGGDAGQARDQARDRACGEQGWQIVRFDESMREQLDASVAQVVRIHRRRCRDLRNAS